MDVDEMMSERLESIKERVCVDSRAEITAG